MSVPAQFPPVSEIKRLDQNNKFYSLFNSDAFSINEYRVKMLLQEFFKQDMQKMNVLAIAFNLAPVIVEAGSDFLFGEDIKIEVDDSSDTDGKIQTAIDTIVKRNNLQQKLYDSSKLFQAIGHTQFKLRKDVVDNKSLAVIEEISYDHWFPDYSGIIEGGQTQHVIIMSYLSKLDDIGNITKKYIYIEEHEPGTITYSLYEDNDGHTGRQVPLNTLQLPIESAELFFVENTGLTVLPLVEIDGPKTIKERQGQSLLKRVLSLLDEVNTRVTQISLQMLKHLDPKLQLPKGSVLLDENGNVQRKDLEVILAEQGDADAKYITNDNPLIEEAFKWIEMCIEEIARITKTPNEFLYKSDKGGVESAEALKTRFMPFLKRIAPYRKSYKQGIEQMMRIALQLEGVQFPDDLEIKVTFDYGLPKNLEEDGKVWGTAYGDGIASLKTAVKNFQGLPEGDLLDEEIKEIEADRAAMPAFGASNGQPGLDLQATATEG